MLSQLSMPFLTCDSWISVALNTTQLSVCIHKMLTPTVPGRILLTGFLHPFLLQQKTQQKFQLYIFFSFFPSGHVQLGLCCCKTSCAFQLSSKKQTFSWAIQAFYVACVFQKYSDLVSVLTWAGKEELQVL